MKKKKRDDVSQNHEMLREVIAGLKGKPKTLPSKYFYDDVGAELFERICEQPEYYPTRVEKGIMREKADEMAGMIGRRCVLIELGSGSGEKSELLLEALEDMAAYVPVDISQAQLVDYANKVRAQHEDLFVQPMCCDFTKDLRLPTDVRDGNRRVVYFPGSTIGNFHHGETRDLLSEIRRLVGQDGGLLIGVDLRKDREVLERAYNDEAGVTAAFNLNLLRHINAETGSDFSLDGFDHRAVWNDEHGRIEMHLVSQREQIVGVNGHEFAFEAGELIRSECSYKYELEEFDLLAEGFLRRGIWTDPHEMFSVQYFQVAEEEI